MLDLCAAPGGWTQIASRIMAKQETIIVSVDILPIRSLGPNVITLIGDITTDSCKAEIRQNLQGAPVDVVLHDGAPNVGASYEKDAYEQNEIALHALKCATQHLRRNGHFITKLYRSRDYASYVWVAKQFFEHVQAVKPNASRSQSAEIFLVCQNYIAPTKIDPRMLDPKHVFEHVEGDSTGGGNAASKFNIFHKQWDAQKRPNRSGYDMDNLDFSMRKVVPIREFIEGKAVDTGIKKGPIDILSTSTGMSFTCESCASGDTKNCHCQFYLNHPSTTFEIKACVSDLKVLNKSDFKGLLIWRTKLLDELKKMEEAEKSDDSSTSEAEGDGVDEANSDQEEEQIQAEIAEMRQRRLRERKKLKKKERAEAAKRRRRAALGMDLNAIDVPEHDQVFSLATITSKGALEAVGEVDLNKVTHEEIFGPTEEEKMEIAAAQDDDVDSQGEKDDIDEITGYSYRLDREMDEAYDRYLSNTKDGRAKSGTKMAKRSKKQQRIKAAEEAAEDEEMFLNDAKGVNHDTKTYAKMLQGPKDSDDSDDDLAEEEDDDDDSDGFHDEPLLPEEYALKKERKKRNNEFEAAITEKSSNPLIHKLEEPKSAKTARWFSNPLFETMGNTAALAAMGNKSSGKQDLDQDFSSDDESSVNEVSDGDAMQTDDESEDDAEVLKCRKTTKSKQKNHATGLSADEVLASMPKTDKQIRHEKRIKALERQERQQARKAKKADRIEGGFEIAPADDDNSDDENDDKLEGLSDAKRKKVLEARELIKAGMGSGEKDGDDTKGFEVVSAAETSKSGRPLPLMDKRKYDSENEDYDSDDYVRTLALGTMMLRKSKAKALVDASYNRFAWNDPEDLPDWFVDDENRFYRPQLPIPQALLDKLKAKQLALAERPIAKVAEARARKSKRAKDKLKAAKKKAEAVAQSSEMSETMKLKAISKAMRGQEGKNAGKTYVVARKGGSNKGGKGIKVVDKRMKNDKRSMDRADRKRKTGKKGGLTGSKRRRHHK